MPKFDSVDRVIVSRKPSGGEGAGTMATIGIKIANGDFYSIMEENSSVKKRLVLTTVHDRQRSVQIDLYRSLAQTMSDAQYIGSLVVEKIKPKSKGEPSIELVISSSEKGDIVAEAVDLETGGEGESYVLNVSLRTLDEENQNIEIPDFEIEQNSDHPPAGLYQQAETVQREEKKASWLLVALLVLLLVVGLAALWYFFLGGRSLVSSVISPAENQSGQTVPLPAAPPSVIVTQPPVQPPETPPVPDTAQVQTPPPVFEAPVTPPPPKPQTVERKRPAPPVASYKVPVTIPKGGVAYKIRWGDTLWDIAGAFYRNPWLYPRIARYNNIRNPDLIISGTTIQIPPKN